MDKFGVDFDMARALESMMQPGRITDNQKNQFQEGIKQLVVHLLEPLKDDIKEASVKLDFYRHVLGAIADLMLAEVAVQPDVS